MRSVHTTLDNTIFHPMSKEQPSEKEKTGSGDQTDLRLHNGILFLLVIFLWGLTWPSMKIGLAYVSPMNFLRQRFIFSAIALSPYVLFMLRKIPKNSGTLPKLLVFSLINILSSIATLIGLVNQGSGIASVLTYTQPLFVFCLAIPFLKERVDTLRLLGAVTGFVGVVVLFSGALGSFMLDATVILLLGAFLWSAAIVFYKKYLSQTYPLIANFSYLSVGAVILSIWSLIANDYTFPTDTTYIISILYTSLAGLSVAMTIWLFLLRVEDATVIAGSSFLVPVVALFLGWKFLGESLYLESTLGSVLVLLGVYLVNLRQRNRQSSFES